MTLPDSTKPKALQLGLQVGDIELGEYLSALQKHFEATEPQLLAFLDERNRFQRLKKEAERLERSYPDPNNRPPLYGLPVGIKDIFHVDGFPTRAGSQLPQQSLKGPEAHSVRQLKEAGALVMGKTATTEFAFFAPGPTRNPHNLAHTPGGSSSGSAAAVAAGIVPLALGTQTIGSVIRPASFCGILGFKPSYERISRQGVIPLSPSLDHVGLFAADVATAQLAASLLCRDWQQSTTASMRPILAIPEGAYLENVEADMLAHFQSTVQKLRKAGFWVKSLDPMPDFDEIVERHMRILEAEAAEVHSEWYRLYNQRYHPRTAEMLQRGMQINKERIGADKDAARYFSETLRTLMDLHGIDLWISPAAPGAAPLGLESTGNPIMNLPWTQAGLPALTLPTGIASNGLPLGTQFVADFNRDEELFAWGAEIGRVLGAGA